MCEQNLVSSLIIAVIYGHQCSAAEKHTWLKEKNREILISSVCDNG